jgi:hypothetical protein
MPADVLADRSSEPIPPPPRHLVKRVLLAAAIALASMNIWTGAPLLAVWFGSHFHGDKTLSMTALFMVVVILVLAEIALVFLLSRLTGAYDDLTGRPEAMRRTSPWLRSMRGERETTEEQRKNLGAVERILVVSVVLAVVAFEAWFFFFSPSPI